LAIGLTYAWRWDFCREFPADLLKQGYHWWLTSMKILMVGSFLSVVVDYGTRLSSRASSRS
jgi:hypothetical protein